MFLFIIAKLVVAYFSFVILRWLYRLSPLHPLYHFPWGSRFGAMTEWYEFYWNVIRQGRYLFEIEEYHKKYGPIVRTGPNELHISDSTFYGTVFAVGYKFPIRSEHYKASNTAGLSQFGLTDVEEHKRRKAAYGPLFSKSGIAKVEPQIWSYIQRALSYTDAHGKDKDGLFIGKLFRCLTVDIISLYTFAESLDTLAQGNLDPPILIGMKEAVKVLWFINFFYVIQDIMNHMPLWVLKVILPDDLLGAKIVEDKGENDVREFLKDPYKAKQKASHKTVFEALVLDGPQSVKDYRVPSFRALKHEAWGTETTGNSLTIGLYEAIKQPEIQRKLYRELCDAFPNMNDINFAACEKLPYLSSFIKEVLRVVPGIVGRMPRIVPASGAMVDGKFIKPGTFVSMSAYMMHNDPAVFSNPDVFNPSRWSDASEDDMTLMERNWVPFSRGSRACVGQNLAWMELYLAFASMFRTFEFSFHENNTLGDEWLDMMVLHRPGDLVVTAKRR